MYTCDRLSGNRPVMTIPAGDASPTSFREANAVALSGRPPPRPFARSGNRRYEVGVQPRASSGTSVVPRSTAFSFRNGARCSTAASAKPLS